jgi:hypothetical protein
MEENVGTSVYLLMINLNPGMPEFVLATAVWSHHITVYTYAVVYKYYNIFFCSFWPLSNSIYNFDDDDHLIIYVSYYYFNDLFNIRGRCLHGLCGTANK